MGKLGKKARKFARKNLQAVMKRKRKFNSGFKKKITSSSRFQDGGPEDQGGDVTSNRRESLIENIEDASLDIFSSEEDNDMAEAGSDTDEYLSEDSSCSYAHEGGTVLYSEDATQGSEISIQNQNILTELLKKKKKLEALKCKDPDFVIYLQDHLKSLESLDDENMTDEDETGNHDLRSFNGVIPSSNGGRLISMTTIKTWFQIVKEQENLSVLRCLLNAYRAACHYGDEFTSSDASISLPMIQKKETYSSILMFMLSEGDMLFRGLLGLSANCKMDTLTRKKDSSKWESVKLMVKSFLSSTLFLLNQFTDTDLIAYSLNRLRVSLVFFAAFPSLRRRLTEVAVHLWATGGGILSFCAFLVIHDLATFFDQDSDNTCLKKTYKAFISRCKVMDSSSLKHIEYIKTSFVELCSIDLQKSVIVALASVQKLIILLQLGLQPQEEALKKICSWEYVLCIDLWVKFVSINIKDIDLHGLLFPLIQVINGVAKIFSGARYLPLRVKCIRWLNELSASSKNFIPVSSLALDILESSNPHEAGKPEKGDVNLLTVLKLPKSWLKSRDFQEDCVFAAVELLCAHFLQWSHHISFPDLVTIPIIRLKQFYEKSTVESLRRPVKRLIDQVHNVVMSYEILQRNMPSACRSNLHLSHRRWKIRSLHDPKVERNMEFVQRKREDVSFSPTDQASADLFLQSEKCDNSPFIQYYKSVEDNALTRKLRSNDETSVAEKKKQNRRKRKLAQKTEGLSTDDAKVKRQRVVKAKKQKS